METDTLLGVAAGLAAGILLVVLGWLFTRLAGARRGRRAIKAEAPKWEEHHRPVYAHNPEQFGHHPLGLALAVSAGFTLCRNEPLDEFGYRDATGEQELLARHWSIHNRSDVLEQIWWLLTQGHRTEWETLRAMVVSGDPQLRALRRGLSRQYQTNADAREQLLRIRRMQRNERDVQRVNFSAWDLSRAVMLARSGMAAGYLERELAEDIALQAAGYLQQEYASWQQFSQTMLTSRWFWNSKRGVEDQVDTAHDQHNQAVLLSADGPYQLVDFTPRGRSSRNLLLASDPPHWAMLAAHVPGDLGRDWQRELLMRARTGTGTHQG